MYTAKMYFHDRFKPVSTYYLKQICLNQRRISKRYSNHGQSRLGSNEGHSTFPNLLEQELYHWIQFTVILREQIFWREGCGYFKPSARDAAGVFYALLTGCPRTCLTFILCNFPKILSKNYDSSESWIVSVFLKQFFWRSKDLRSMSVPV